MRMAAARRGQLDAMLDSIRRQAAQTDRQATSVGLVDFFGPTCTMVKEGGDTPSFSELDDVRPPLTRTPHAPVQPCVLYGGSLSRRER